MGLNGGWNTLAASEQSAHRARAVEAWERCGRNLTTASQSLRAAGAPYCSRDFIRNSVARSGKGELVAVEEMGQASGSPVGMDLDDLKTQILGFMESVLAQRSSPTPIHSPPSESPSPRIESVPSEMHDPDAVLAMLRKRPLTLAEIATAGQTNERTAAAWLGSQRERGVNLHEIGGKWSVEKTAVAGNRGGTNFEYVSRPDNTFLFGACGDQHMGSKYERLDVLEDLYDHYAAEGVDRVYNTGNWIDGEARFNKFDLKVHGMDQQLAYLAEHYPQRLGIETWAVAGNDHEGWYGQREGVEIGHYAEVAMRDSGRDDWHHLGFIESHVRLVNANTGKTSILTVMHPGGGSAYAVSYQPQKLVESLEGGEKPAVLLLGHYHKLSSNNIRNVWVVQTGCSQDQTPFMKQKRIDAHVGGMIIRMRQDPETGAIVRFQPDMLRYFNQGYYVGRWSHSKGVVLPERS